MKHLIVSCTKGKKEDTLLYRSIKQINANITFIENNIEGLSKIYNNYLGRTESVIFIHDDVEIVDPLFIEKVELAYKDYGIVGLAGCLNPEIKAPALWHLMSNKNNHYGEVGHFINGQKHVTCFGPTPHRVLIIDGLFIATHTPQIKNFKFDEDFTFHHYDLSVGLNANKLGIKVGVYPISVYHQSPGLLNYHDTNYQKSQEIFIKKYSF